MRGGVTRLRLGVASPARGPRAHLPDAPGPSRRRGASLCSPNAAFLSTCGSSSRPSGHSRQGASKPRLLRREPPGEHRPAPHSREDQIPRSQVGRQREGRPRGSRCPPQPPGSAPRPGPARRSHRALPGDPFKKPAGRPPERESPGAACHWPARP